MYRYGINTNVLHLTFDFSSSCFIADDTQVQIVWLHVAVFSKFLIFEIISICLNIIQCKYL